MLTLNCKGGLIDISSPKVMGILNVTPDSFYDGGQHSNPDAILARVSSMLEEGATFIDVGGYSSRPGAEHISNQEELQRVLPVVKLIISHFPDCLISVDTFRSSVARACVEAGASMINDISAGLLDPEMIPTVGQLAVPYIMMHMKGTPQTMKAQTNYEDLVTDLLYYFSKRIALARENKINDIIIDPGFGFSKTLEQNYELLNKLDLLKLTDLPILVGLSRKSMIYKPLNSSPENALNGTSALNAVALIKGANILRVHDVKEANEVITLTQKLNL